MHDISTNLLELMDYLPGVVFGLEIGEKSGLWFVSDRVQELLGYNKEQFMAEPAFWLDLVHSCDRRRVEEGLDTILDTQVLSQEYRFLNREGAIIWVEAEMKLVTDPKGQALGVIGFWNDVSERCSLREKLRESEQYATDISNYRKVEQELRASEERFMKAFQLSPALTAITSLTDGTFLEVNDAFLQTLGYKREEVIGRRREELNIWIESSITGSILKDILQQGSIRNKEITFKDVHGKTHTGLFFAAPIVSDGKDYLLSVALDITARKKYEEQLSYQAYHDLLTRLPNRRLFEERLRYIIADARRRQEKVAVLFLDLDGFKQVNDILGHEAGDKVLRDTADDLTRCLREADTVARLGGDEFMIILPHLQTQDDVRPVIERILNTCRRQVGLIALSVSIGVAFYPDNGSRVATLMKNADIAMYRAKDSGRDRAAYF